MPYPDSEYPSILRGRDKRESQRLLAAAPAMLATLKHAADALDFAQAQVSSARDRQRILLWLGDVEGVIAKAEGRE
jgi:hypothetical protein